MAELESIKWVMMKIYGKFTLHNSRKGNELSAGSGKALFIEGQGKWKKIIGATCVYSIRYLDDRTFSIRKCSINEDMHKHLSKYNN